MSPFKYGPKKLDKFNKLSWGNLFEYFIYRAECKTFFQDKFFLDINSESFVNILSLIKFNAIQL